MAVKATELIMGMPITVEVIDSDETNDLTTIFAYFQQVDEHYSPYKPDSEVSRLNAGLAPQHASQEMRDILALCEETKRQTDGYFDIEHHGRIDPSGLVKGWAIQQAAGRLLARGRQHFYIEAGGDIAAQGQNAEGQPWRVGIRNPFNSEQIIKILAISDRGVATSGSYIRGRHIYDPHSGRAAPDSIKSLTVVGPNIYDADRFATAAFAMGPAGLTFIAQLEGFEGYMIDDTQTASYTSGFEDYVAAR